MSFKRIVRLIVWLTPAICLLIVVATAPAKVGVNVSNPESQNSSRSASENSSGPVRNQQRFNNSLLFHHTPYNALSSANFSKDNQINYNLNARGMATAAANLVARPVRIVAPSFNPGTNGSISIEMDAQGNENAIGFSLTFDKTKLTYVSAVKGTDAIGATVNINTLQLASGRLGLACAFPSGTTFAAGTRQLMVVTFAVSLSATGSTVIGFGDQPIGRELADSDANVLDSTYSPNTVTINPLPNPVPTVSGVAPNLGIVGSPGFTLTVNGSNFVSNSVIRLGGADLPTTFVSSTQLTAQVTAGNIASAGSQNVTVFNPAPGGGASNAVSFAINNPAPAISSLSPASTIAGQAGPLLTVNGSNFVNGSLVNFNGSIRATTFISSTQLTAQISNADSAAAGSFPVTVFNPLPGGGTSNAVDLIVNNPAPSLASLSPSNALAGGAAFALTVNGTNFVNGAVVRLSGVDRTTAFVDNTHLTAQIASADISAAGTLSITVLNPAPGGGESNTISFAIDNPPPTLASLSPTNTLAGSDPFTLTINGSNFINGAIVKLNGSDRTTSFVNASQLTAQITAADSQAAGILAVTVVNPAPGGGASNAVDFTVNNPAPALSSITPTSATAGDAAFTLIVNGSNFVNGSVVKFNGSVRTTSFVSATELTAQISAADVAPAAVVPVTVFSPAPGGGTSSAVDFTVNNPAPALSTLSPTSGIVGGAAFTLTLNGSSFVSGSVVKFNGNNRSTNFVSATQLTAQITAADIQSVGTFAVTVINPAPGGGTSSAVDFAVNNPAPALSSLAPSSAIAGGADFTLTVNGSNFINGSVVKFNGADRTTSFVSATQLTAQISAANISAAGTASVTVFSPAPGGGTSSAVNLLILNPTPNLVTLSPNGALAGDAAFTLTVNGNNFIDGAIVKLNGSDRTTSFVNASQLTAQITAADIQAAGILAVTVVNPAPGGGASNAVDFTVNNPAPALSSITPTSATAGDAAFTLTVNGSNFVNGSVVKFNGSVRTTSFVSATELTAQISAADVAPAAVVPVTVFSPAPGGGTSSAVDFTVNNPAPTLSTLSPTSGIVGGAAFTLTLNGSNFVSGSVVKFNGNNRSTNFVSATQLTAQITAADIQSVGTFAVTVINPAPGGGTSSAVDFAVNNPAPALSSLAPSSAIAGGADFTLTVNGSNFINGSVVKFNGADRTTSFVSATQLTAQISAANISAAGTASVTVFSPAPGGGTSSAVDFTVNNVTPALTSFSPTSAVAGDAAFTLTVSGSNFISSSVVRFDGSNRATSFVSANQLTAQVTAANLQNAGTFPITVFNPAPGGGSSNVIDFTVIAPNPVPRVTTLSPASTTAGGAAFTLTVNGSNFINGSVVRFDGSDRTTAFVNSTQLTAQIKVADIATAGAFPVTVFNPTPGGGTSNAVSFAVKNNPVPTLASISPISATAGGAALTLTVNGTDFIGSSVVRFNGSNRATNFVSTTQLTAQITAADIQAAGTFPVTVQNPAPGGGTTSAIDFTVNNLAPAVGTLSPNSTMAGEGAFTLTVNGTNFIGGSVVRFNGSSRTTNFVSATQLTAQISNDDVASAGIFGVAVLNPAPGGGTSSAADFTVNNPVPVLSSISPNATAAGSPPFTLTLNGSNFVNGSIVRLGGSDCTTNFVSNTQLTAQVPAASISAAGSPAVTVFNPAPGGGSSNALSLTTNNPTPVLSSLSPTSTPAGGPGLVLTVNGTGFVNGSVVRLKGANRVTSFISSSQLTAQVTASDVSSEGSASVVVFNPVPGGGTSNALSFVVDPPPPGSRILRVVNMTATPGSTVNVPIELVSQGDENALGFSLNFDPTQLTFVSSAKGVDAASAAVIMNSNNAAGGHLGIAVSRPAGEAFSAGVRKVLIITFTVPSTGNFTSTDIAFDDSLIRREVVDIIASPLLTSYSPGTVTINRGYEGDVSPRPDGSGDGSVSVQDWSQLGRFIALLDDVNVGTEFQRVDCAPISTLGDGRLSVADWAQAGRYAAHLDAVRFAGGPTSPALDLLANARSIGETEEDAQPGASVVRIASPTLPAGQRNSVSIELDSQGTENALGFSLMFDPARLSFISAEKLGEAGDAALQLNTIRSDKGRVGIALALPVGQTFTPGTHLLLTLTFAVPADVEDAAAPEFADLPIDREVVDANAVPMKASFRKSSAEERNPIDDPQFFVWQHYLDFLNRKPDAGGLDYWTQQLTQCGSDAACIHQRRIAVSAAFFVEQEFQQTGFFISRLYKGTLGRRPAYVEFMAERSRLAVGSDLEMSKQALAEAWIDRPEFQTQYPLSQSGAQFVDGLLRTLRLESGVDLSNERDRFIGDYNTYHSRARIVRLVVDHPAVVGAEYNPAFVLVQYFGYLHRDPDQAGYEFWLNTLNNRQPNNYRGMVCAFITSREYQQRFSSTVTRDNVQCGP